MKKLKVDVDALMVETFEVSRADRATQGTVLAHAWTRFDPTCAGISCDYACITYYDNTCRNVCAV
jgi:hypothetical protein